MRSVALCTVVAVVALTSACGGSSGSRSAKKGHGQFNAFTGPVAVGHGKLIPRNLGRQGSPLTVGQVMSAFRRHGIHLRTLSAPAHTGVVAVALPNGGPFFTRLEVEIHSRPMRDGIVLSSSVMGGRPQPSAHRVVKNVLTFYDPRGRFGARVEAALTTLASAHG